ncbi:MAG: DUF5689 domain-containing protein [Gemmatimonadaceae bacterium]
MNRSLHLKRSLYSAVLATLFIAGACSDPSAPRGRDGSLTVAAYVDIDASGTLTPGDSLLSGFAVTLFRDGAQVAEQSTNAQGLVTFAGLGSGSYRVQPSSAGPSGSVLTTNPAPTLAISTLGDSVRVDFRYVFFPASLSGRLFRDDNGNGVYDPGIDTPGAGLFVRLRAGTIATPGATVDSVTADADGFYVLGPVAPGTYVLDFENPGSLDFGTAGQIRVVILPAGQSLTEQGQFTGSLIISIRTARGKPTGAAVTVVGDVTVPPNIFTSGSGGVNSEIWVQDTSGGIAVFSVPSSSAYVLGDRLEISGNIGAFSGQRQITSPTVIATAGGAVVAPLIQTAAEARSLANEGRLVTVLSLTIVSVPGGTGAAFTVIAANGADTLQIRVAGLNTGLTRGSFTVGNRYSITGILTQFNGTPQLKPRFSTDLVGPVTIAAARASAIGTVVTVAGSVTAPPGRFTSGTNGVNSEMWIQDASGGIAAFPVPTADSLNYAIGDRLEVSGPVSTFSGQLQIGTTSQPPSITELGGSTVLAPVVVTGAGVNAFTNEGQLVVIDSLQVTAIGSGTSPSFNVTTTARDGQTVTLRIVGASATIQNTGLTRSSFTLGAYYSVTGILTRFNTAAQIKPRATTDVVLR